MHDAGTKEERDAGETAWDEGRTTDTGSAVAGLRVQSGKLYRGEQQVYLFGVNWFGFETPDHVVHGLWARDYEEMLAQIGALGFNAVRLPLCPETLHNVPPSTISFAGPDGPMNADLEGLGSLEILDKVVAAAGVAGLYLLLDHHRPDCTAISELWHTTDYSEAQWIDDLVFLATRYRDSPQVIGIDLKNEPHGSATWGVGEADTDWNRAAERAARAVLAANPSLLIFVEGLQENPLCSSQTNHFWGENLEPQGCFPLEISADRLVLSPHVYGPDVYAQPYFADPAFPANMPEIWDKHFGYLAAQGGLLVPGEFGGKYGHGGDARDVAWQQALIDYFLARGICSFFYWSWNPDSGDTGGILTDDWTGFWEDKLANLKRLMDQCERERG